MSVDYTATAAAMPALRAIDLNVPAGARDHSAPPRQGA
jgi:hypothetical protein